MSSIARRSSTSELGYITRGGVGQVGTRARTSASTHARGWCGGSPFLPGAPCAMRARSGRGRHARGRQERRAPPSRTPPRSRTSRFYRALCADDGPWRTRALLPSPSTRNPQLSPRSLCKTMSGQGEQKGPAPGRPGPKGPELSHFPRPPGRDGSARAQSLRGLSNNADSPKLSNAAPAHARVERARKGLFQILPRHALRLISARFAFTRGHPPANSPLRP